MNGKKSVFKNSTFWVILSLVLLYPIGVILMWIFKKSWKLWVKILITVVAVLLLGNTIANPPKTDVSTTKNNVATSNKDVSVKNEEETKNAEEKTKADAEKKTAEDTVKKTPDVLIKEKYNNKIEAASFADGILKVEAKGEMAVWDENDFIKKYPREYFDIFWSGIFLEGVSKVEVVSYSKFNDAKGNESREEAIKMSWNKETVKDANYDKFKDIAMLKPENIYRFSESYNIHVALWRNAKDDTKKNTPLAK